MSSRKFLVKIAATFAIAGMLLTAIVDPNQAAESLNNGDTVEGAISSNSPSFNFRNQSRINAPVQAATGEEYIFNAQQGDTINVAVDVQQGNLAPVLVLFSSQNQRQIAYDDTQNSLRYRVPTSGQYRLLVLSQNNTRGRYTLSISGISDNTVAQGSSTSTNDPRRQLLQNEFGLRVLDSCPPATGSLVIVNFPESTQTYRYCANANRVYAAGEYTYDAISGDLKRGGNLAQNSSSSINDSRRQLLQDEFGLRVLDSCPPATGSLVVVNFPESTQTYRYCANANRVYAAGEYTYDSATGDLQRGRNLAQSTSSASNDPRRQLLQNEFGLNVLENCPAARSSYAVISFPEGSQNYIYCANPNRLFPAGEYSYNASTRDLEAATPARQTERCSLSVGGVCVVR